MHKHYKKSGQCSQQRKRTGCKTNNENISTTYHYIRHECEPQTQDQRVLFDLHWPNA